MQIPKNQRPTEFNYSGQRNAQQAPEGEASFGADQVTLTKVKSGGNPDDTMNIFYGWCTGGASDIKKADVKSMAGDITCFAGGASDVKSNLDDGPLFWCTGGAADADVKSGWLGSGIVADYCFGSATDVRSKGRASY